ncbi:MAG TPA: glucose-1-phosphate adenylyltransferase subunit GlgD [Firmicutes bacterium]|nr:glucose-1-phosphate adenylyltransferase subunit GlgD [Bacillota bacterium]
MMKDVLGIIDIKAQDDILSELTDFRCIASVPFGGRYRLVDFILSSMANSGLQRVAVFTLYKYGSLMDHLETGKSWDLNRKEDGLHILSPNIFYSTQPNLPGNIKLFYSQLDFLGRCRQNDAIISPGNLVCNLNFRKAMAFHKEKRADITVFYRAAMGNGSSSPWGYGLVKSPSGRVLQIEKGSKAGQGSMPLVEIFILSKQLLLEMVESGIINGAEDLFRDIIFKYQDEYNIYALPIDSYFAEINSIEHYYQANIDLLNPKIRQSLFFEPGLIYTKGKDEPPSRYLNGSHVTNSLLANGCVVEGTVNSSILSRGVKVEKGAFIENSIIMQKSHIGENSHVEFAILDKEVTISSGGRIIGGSSNPIVIGKRKKL